MASVSERTVRPWRLTAPVRVTAVLLALAGLPRAAGAVEEDAIGWWIYAGSVRSTLLSRFIGPEGRTPDALAKKRAWLSEACVKYGFRFTTRLHIILWGDERGR